MGKTKYYVDELTSDISEVTELYANGKIDDDQHDRALMILQAFTQIKILKTLGEIADSLEAKNNDS